VLVLGVFSNRVTKEGAIAGMVTGIVFAASYILYFEIPKLGGSDSWFSGISPEGIGSIGMLLNFSVTLLVTRFTPQPPPEVRAMIEENRLPSLET